MRLVGLSYPFGEPPAGRREGEVLSADGKQETGAQRVMGTICPLTGLPTQHTRFFWDFLTMSFWVRENLVTEQETVCYHQPGFGFAAEVRNRVCAKFAASDGGDWLFFLDADNTFQPDILKRMLDSQQEIAEQHGACDILTGLYFKKWPPFEPLAYHETDKNPFVHTLDYPAEPFEVSGCGAGCLLIQRPVIERILMELRVLPFGWIGTLHNRQSAVWMEKYMRDFTTEDFPFNLRCKELGYKTWCDPRITLGHMTLAEITDQDFLEFRERSRLQAAAQEAAPPGGNPLTTQSITV